MIGDSISVDKFIGELVDISRYYGKDPDIIQAGGGNTSLKINGNLWIKASGVFLKDVRAKEDFVVMDMEKVKSILNDGTLETEDRKGDLKINEKLFSARLENTAQRPSIETFIHAVMDERFVMHSHPIYVNAMTCLSDGREIIKRFFNEYEYIWVPYKKPGYFLGRTLYSARLEKYKRFSAAPKIVFLQNHGLIISGDCVKDVKIYTDRVISFMQEYFDKCKIEKIEFENIGAHAARIINALLESIEQFSKTRPLKAVWSQCPYVNLLSFDKNFAEVALRGALYPDHIVYCGEGALLIEVGDDRKVIQNKADKFIEDYGYEPRYVVIHKVGVIIIGYNESEIFVREEMLRTHVKTMKLILSRGLPLFIDAEECKYLAHWEAEKHRQKAVNANGDLKEYRQ